MPDTTTQEPGAGSGEQGARSTVPIGTTEWLEIILDHYRGWMKSDTIIELSGNLLSFSAVNAIAAASSDIISGQRGYRHLRWATQDELSHCLHDLESRAAALTRRAIRIRNRAHARIG